MTDVKNLIWTNGDEASLKALWETVLDRQTLTYLIKGKNGEVTTVNIERVADN